MLEGFDKEWNYVGSKNSATYMNLHPGNYIFKVKSQDSSGSWSSQILTLNVSILPPFWLTWWFKILGLFAFGLAIYIAYYLKLKRYRKKQKELSILVEKRTLEITSANITLLERQRLIEEQSEELRVHAENLIEANDLLIQNQSLIKAQSDTIQEANTELIKLNKTKDRILSIIAHDLRNPFNVVSGFSEILLEEYRTLPLQTIETYLNYISNSSKNGNTLLENLLQWSRTQTGSMTFEPIQLNLLLVAEEIYNFLEGAAHKKNISIQLQIDPALNIKADENMLKAILRNLLSNALKFTHENGIISVKAFLTPDHVEIVVSDSGVGIPEERIPLLFKIETNSSTKGTSQESGSGLGLILCKEFVEKHHGKIWVESKVGYGSQFKFTLPLF
jgi:signal transduction histidine kinase